VDVERVTHEVMVLCNCDSDPCRMELYVSDVRIAVAEIDRLRGYERTIEGIWGTGLEVLKAS
jgi:hypothetical protein